MRTHEDGDDALGQDAQERLNTLTMLARHGGALKYAIGRARELGLTDAGIGVNVGLSAQNIDRLRKAWGIG